MLMLALAAYDSYKVAEQNDCEPQLIILEDVSSTMAALLRSLIKREKICLGIAETWDNTIGPIVSADAVIDGLTGGLISEHKVGIEELQTAIKTIGEEELLTFKDIFGGLDTCVNKGWSEEEFIWSGTSRYRRTTQMCRNLVKRAEWLPTQTDDPKVSRERDLYKPRRPDFVIMPPASDVEDLFEPPDFSGVDASDPVSDVCGALVALFEWAAKEPGAGLELAGDLVKMAASPGSHVLRLGLHELAMMVWDVITKTHEVLAHTGFMSPYGEIRYPDSDELRLPNEIGQPLIILGGTVDDGFRQALDDALDPLGNLDRDPDLFATGHSLPIATIPTTSGQRLPVVMGHRDQS
jgi:hypothetical protein